MTSEITTNPAAARVQLMAVPAASPGCCGLCGKSEHPDGFADARLDFEFYGTFYLCGDCVGDYARLYGWLHPAQAIALARKYDEVSKELEIHREALLLLEQSVEGLTNYRMLRSIATDTNNGSDLDDSNSERTEEVGNAISTNVVNLPTANSEPESNASELTTEQRSNDVSSTTSDDAITIVEL